jgi:hypothetical protein
MLRIRDFWLAELRHLCYQPLVAIFRTWWLCAGLLPLWRCPLPWRVPFFEPDLCI